MCPNQEYINIPDWTTFSQKRTCFNSWDVFLPNSKQKKTFLFSTEKTSKSTTVSPWKQRKLALRALTLAAGILESFLEGNKSLIKTQYLQWPLSNSRCRRADFSTNNKEGLATRSDSPKQTCRRLELHGTQKRDWAEMKQRKKNPDPSPNTRDLFSDMSFYQFFPTWRGNTCYFIFSGYDYGFISLCDALHLHPNTMSSFYTEWLI